jgi:hypothetical protein
MTDQTHSPQDDAGSRPAACTPGELALHLTSEHADPMAMDRAHIFNEGQHHHEHTGPGTIRNHPEDDFSYDRAKADAVLREAEGDDWQARPPSPGEALAAYAPTGNLRDEEPVRVETEDEAVTPEEDARMRAVYRALAENDMPGDPPFNLDELKRRLDEAMFPGRVFLGSATIDGPPREAVTYNWRTRLPSLEEMLSRHHALYVVDPKAPAVEMTEERPTVYGRPSAGKSLAPGLAILMGGQLDPSVDLAMHLAGVHADATAIETGHEHNLAFHHEEHEGGGWDHPEGDLSYDPARAAEIIAQRQEDAGLSQGFHLALHLASAHKDDQAFFRTDEQNEAAHRAVPAFLHQHADVQHRYERALAEKIEADLGDGTTMSWCPVPHPPHEVSDLARMIGDIHDQNPEMAADLIAVDLAWIKTAGWPLHRRLLAALLIAFPLSWPPSWYIDKRVRKAVRK